MTVLPFPAPAGQLLTVRDVARLWQVSVRSVWRRVESGQLRTVRLGCRTVRFRPEDVLPPPGRTACPAS